MIYLYVLIFYFLLQASDELTEDAAMALLEEQENETEDVAVSEQ